MQHGNNLSSVTFSRCSGLHNNAINILSQVFNENLPDTNDYRVLNHYQLGYARFKYHTVEGVIASKGTRIVDRTEKVTTSVVGNVEDMCNWIQIKTQPHQHMERKPEQVEPHSAMSSVPRMCINLNNLQYHVNEQSYI